MEQQQTQRQELEVLLRQHVDKAHVEVLSSQQRGFRVCHLDSSMIQ